MKDIIPVSIIIPAYNAEQTISESIESVIKQKFTNWELIIINDGSIDKTIEIVNPYVLTDTRIKLINLKTNVGLPSARNIGINLAKGRYVAFLDSDDMWFPNKLSLQFDFHQRNPEIKISHTAYRMFNSSGMIRRPIREYFAFLYRSKRKLIPFLYKRNSIGILTVMLERDLLLKVNGFDCDLWTMEDNDLWIRIAKLNEPFGYLNKDLALYRISALAMSSNIGKYKKAYKELIDKHKEGIIAYHVLNNAMANYYCLFGINYFKKGNYKMSNLYFYNAIKNNSISFTTITSIFYLIFIQFKSIK